MPSNEERLKQIEEKAFRTFYPRGYIHDGANTLQDLARLRGVMRQREMLAGYARRKAAGEFPDGPEVHGA